jgi:hypothetical protein
MHIGGFMLAILVGGVLFDLDAWGIVLEHCSSSWSKWPFLRCPNLLLPSLAAHRRTK